MDNNNFQQILQSYEQCFETISQYLRNPHFCIFQGMDMAIMTILFLFFSFSFFCNPIGFASFVRGGQQLKDFTAKRSVLFQVSSCLLSNNWQPVSV